MLQYRVYPSTFSEILRLRTIVITQHIFLLLSASYFLLYHDSMIFSPIAFDISILQLQLSQPLNDSIQRSILALAVDFDTLYPRLLLEQPSFWSYSSFSAVLFTVFSSLPFGSLPLSLHQLIVSLQKPFLSFFISS